MTDEVVDETVDPIVALRDANAPNGASMSKVIDDLRHEMNAQFNEMKESFKAELSEKDNLIAQLKEQNTGLQRAIVRSAVMDPPKQEVVKTEAELYQEKIDALARRTLEIMSAR